MIIFRFEIDENREGLITFITPWSGTKINDRKTKAEALVQLVKVLEHVVIDTPKRFARSRMGGFNLIFIHINKN